MLMWIKTQFLKFRIKVIVWERFRYKQFRYCWEFTFETSHMSLLTPVTNENRLCTRGILHSEKLHAVLPSPLPSVPSVKQIAYYHTYFSTRCLQIPFGHINWMPLDYAVCSTLYDKQNRAPRRRLFILSWVYHDSDASSRPFISEAYFRFHASTCRVCVGLSSTGTRFFPVCFYFPYYGHSSNVP